VNHKFTGQEEDSETGLYNYGARYYDPAVGRFISADSIVPDYTNPQSLNRYSYVLNNPLNYTDPTGKWFCGVHFGITFAAALSLNFSFFDALSLAWESMLNDFNSSTTAKDAASANMHGMGGRIGKDWQSPQEAKRATWTFASEAKARGYIGYGLHAVEDLAIHEGKSMKDYGFTDPLGTVWSGILDFFGIDKIGEAYQNAKDLLQDQGGNQGQTDNAGPSFDDRGDWC
jgi:RHS repeat-associated protein